MPGSLFGRKALQCCGDQIPLLLLMQGGNARRRRSRPGAAGIQEFMLEFELRLETMADLIPRALILRLFLAPDDLACVRVFAQDRLVFLGRKRIQLLDANDRDRFELRFAPRFQQIEINLAAAKHNARHRGSLDVVDLIDHRLKSAAAELLEPRHGQGMAQQALRRHDDERLAQCAQHLPAQHVKHLRRRRGHAHLHVVFGA